MLVAWQLQHVEPVQMPKHQTSEADMDGHSDKGNFVMTLFGTLLLTLCVCVFVQSIADQLRGGDMKVDFDQIFAKRASSADSAFLW